MQCGEEGETRLLLTSIPYFRDVIIMSFSCPHCHQSSSEVQPASEIGERGRRFTLSVSHSEAASTRRSLDRQIIRSETAVIRIPELEFEMEPTRTRGDINTVEGVLGNIADSLQVGQANRALQDVEQWRRLTAVIEEMQAMRDGQRSFTFVLDDPAGNSFIENPHAPVADTEVRIETYSRTPEQTAELGYALEEDSRSADDSSAQTRGAQGEGQSSSDRSGLAVQSTGVPVSAELQERLLDTYFNVSDRSAILSSDCPSCHRQCETRMAVTAIPHFKEVVLMSTQCDSCGYRDTEVKPAGRVSAQAVRISLRVETVDDLKRDLLKSDTASIAIPELELELMPGTLGGKYSTLEGILHDIRQQLAQVNPFHVGDSSEAGTRSAFASFLSRLDDCIAVSSPFTFVLTDPLSNSHIFSPLPDGSDPGLTIVQYERSWEDNEELGLNDVEVDVQQYASEDDRRLFAEEMRRDEEGRAAREGGTADSRDRDRQRREDDERQRQSDGVTTGKVGGNIRISQPDTS